MKTESHDNPPAFPQHGWTSDPETLARMARSGMGITTRDYFAAKALPAVWADAELTNDRWRNEGSRTRITRTEIAETSYAMADAMLRARAANPTGDPSQ